MAVREITRTGAESALEEFRRIGLDAMLEAYGGDPSRDWYAEAGNWVYGPKFLLRAAHVHRGLIHLPPCGSRRFIACQAAARLKSVHYLVMVRCEATDADLESPKAAEASVMVTRFTRVTG